MNAASTGNALRSDAQQKMDAHSYAHIHTAKEGIASVRYFSERFLYKANVSYKDNLQLCVFLG